MLTSTSCAPDERSRPRTEVEVEAEAEIESGRLWRLADRRGRGGGGGSAKSPAPEARSLKPISSALGTGTRRSEWRGELPVDVDVVTGVACPLTLRAVLGVGASATIEDVRVCAGEGGGVRDASRPTVGLSGSTISLMERRRDVGREARLWQNVLDTVGLSTGGVMVCEVDCRSSG
jgi:hypothetical protein